MMKDFTGMIAAMATPFLPNEELNYPEAARLVKHLLHSGLNGVLIGGTTGEYHLMSIPEREQLIACAVEAAKDCGEDKYIIAGASCHRTKETVALAHAAGEAGADFVLVLPPYYLPTSRQGIIDYYREIAANTKAGVIIYHYPSNVNVYLEPEFIMELSSIENMVGIKNTVDMHHTVNLIALNEHNPKFRICNGFEHLILSNLASGGDACMGIVQNLAPRQLSQLYAAMQRGDYVAASKIQDSLVPLYNLLETAEDPCPAPVKYGLEIQGFHCGLPRRPLVPLSEGTKVRLKQVMEQIGLI